MPVKIFMTDDNGSKNESEASKEGVSRREFLKFGVGAAAVAVGATALMGKLPIPLTEPKKTAPANDSAEPIVATVTGDQVTVMNGQVITKTRDSGLAALIAEKVNGED